MNSGAMCRIKGSAGKAAVTARNRGRVAPQVLCDTSRVRRRTWLFACLSVVPIAQRA